MTSSVQAIGYILPADEEQQVAEGVRIEIRSNVDGAVIGSATTDCMGAFSVWFSPREGGSHLRLEGEEIDSESVVLPSRGSHHDMFIRIPPRRPVRREEWLGGRWVDADALKSLLRAAPEFSAVSAASIVDLLKPVPGDDLRQVEWCETPRVQWLSAIGTESALADLVARLLPKRPPAGPNLRTLDCTPFRIDYEAGSNGPDPHSSRTPILLPGSATVVGFTSASGVPNYVQRTCFWLTYARRWLIDQGNGFRDPGSVEVGITVECSSGCAGDGQILINPRLSDDLLARLLVHEYMHLIQERYESTPVQESWRRGREGGGVMGEELLMPAINHHVAAAIGPGGILSHPERAMSQRAYSFSLLLQYLAEQHPAGGGWVYRTILEKFASTGYDPAKLEQTAQELWPIPPSHGIRVVAGSPVTTIEVLLGNFWLACALKDIENPPRDRRFGFVSNVETALLADVEKIPRYARMWPVSITRAADLTRDGSCTCAGWDVSPYGARFFRFELSSTVDHVRVFVQPTGGLTRPLVQIAVVEGGGVREIVRSVDDVVDVLFTSDRNGIRIHHLWVLVAATEKGGTFTLRVIPG